MKFSVKDETGAPVEFECPETIDSRWTCGAILEDRTYPLLPFVDDVTVALDVGSNCGAMAVHLARHYPGATVHAFEPGREARGYLERNTADLPSVVVHPFGLAANDGSATLHIGGDIGQASVLPPTGGEHRTEQVELRSAEAWAADAGIDRIDVLKVDVEGCEVQVLEGLASLLPTVKVLYVEYDSRVARRAIDSLLAPTHELYLAMLMALDQGECMYVRKDLADHPQAVERLRAIFSRTLDRSA
jgi:FkbM family methyltransferase